MNSPTPTPRTEAGKAFEARFNDPATRPRHLHDVRPAILAIEREAYNAGENEHRRAIDRITEQMAAAAPLEPPRPDPVSMRQRLATALYQANDGSRMENEYTISERMMSVHGGPLDSSYLDAADMILGTPTMLDYAAHHQRAEGGTAQPLPPHVARHVGDDGTYRHDHGILDEAALEQHLSQYGTHEHRGGTAQPLDVERLAAALKEALAAEVVWRPMNEYTISERMILADDPWRHYAEKVVARLGTASERPTYTEVERLDRPGNRADLSERPEAPE